MNPLANNPLKTRDDFARSVVALWDPLKPYFTKGCARVDLGQTGAHFTKAAAELEGFARPLFGLAPLAMGNLPFDDWDMMRAGYANGCNPEHAEYWGDVYDKDQRLVESAALGFGLLLAKDKLWDPLTDIQKVNVGIWLESTLNKRVADNNWHFFTVFASMALEHVGVAHDLTFRERALVRLESFYIDDGWYSDGENRRFDHYVPFAMHLYGLVYSKLAKGDEARCSRFRDRAAKFAVEFQHWFDAHGASMAYGRSMTYRFAQASFWGGLAFADVEALPWGQIRGLWARNLRWWSNLDYFDRDGIMPVGYSYPNLMMSEGYNSPGSPYWAMKAYFPLALAADHPFWLAKEEDKAEADAAFASPVTGTVGFGAGGNRVMLVSCSEMRGNQRCGAEKYSKFAYSSAFGFSVDTDRQGFQENAFDNMLAVSDDCQTYVTRADMEDNHIGSNWLYSRWRAGHGVEVKSWLIAQAPWHLRAHKVTLDRPMFLTEGGFAIERTDVEPVMERVENGVVQVITKGAASLALDLSPTPRRASARRATPNSSLYFPRTYVPHLGCQLSAGTHWLIGAYAASMVPSDGQAWMDMQPKAPDLAWLETLPCDDNKVVGMQWREPDPWARGA
jgi:hypothetical protein